MLFRCTLYFVKINVQVKNKTDTSIDRRHALFLVAHTMNNSVM